jgi:phosphoglycolate phosphatase-like HAD superfamily hydrolase
MSERPPRHARAILFDLDGTLIATSNRWGELLGQTLDGLEILPSSLDAKALGRRVVLAIEMPMNYLIATIERLRLDGLFQGVADRARRSRGVATHGSSVLLEGAGDLVASLGARYRLGVVTTRARREAHAILRRAGLEGHFAAIVTRQDVWFLKPHPEPIRRAAALLGVSPGECIMVGDTTMDVRAARRAGAYAVGVLTGMAIREELERAGAQCILERAIDLEPFLLGQDSRDSEED